MVAADEAGLHLTISNSKPVMAAASVGGLGLTNVRKRLDLLYPGHTLRITSEPDEYQVDLKLPLRVIN